jgi:hypothetical protein
MSGGTDENRYKPVRTTTIPADIRTEQLLITSQERYRYASPFGERISDSASWRRSTTVLDVTDVNTARTSTQKKNNKFSEEPAPHT